jgi:Ni,Fe-hydrogenase I cytochrome b subunit
MVPILFAVAFITFLYGVAKKYIFARGDEAAVEEGHKLILWGVIGFVVMISIWGLVNVVNDTLGLSTNNTLHNLPQTPTTP